MGPWLRHHYHSKNVVIDPETGSAVDWDNLVPDSLMEGNLVVVIDGGGSAITTGIKHDVPMPFSGTIVAWEMLADQSGSIVIDIWKDTFANFPPVDADSITGGAEPEISGATKANVADDAVAWAFNAGDILRFSVDSVATVQRVTLSLKYRRSA